MPVPVSDEQLAESVRKYAIIYDKGRSGHKDKLAVENAWHCVAKECKISEVKVAKRLFDNLKKRFNKRRRNPQTLI